jgi:uncharacterized membrane protein
MKEPIRCKSCGFIMEKGKLHGKCPACGVSEKMFEPYEERISPKRKFLLSLDLHPVFVHFPQAFIATIPLLSLIALMTGGSVHATVCSTISVLDFALPLTVLAAFLAGLFDGKIRFRRVTTPLLVRKMAWGSLLFLLSGAIFLIGLLHPVWTNHALLAVLALSLASLGCAAYLGLIGTSLINSKFPG